MTTATVWQLLLVDDDWDIRSQVQEGLNGEIIQPDGHLQVRCTPCGIM